MLSVKILFACCVSLLLYVYLGYPLLVLLISSVRKKPVQKGHHEPAVSILIAAHNEEAHIARTVQNKIDQDYPREKLDILVVSDASTDRTDAEVQPFAHYGVRLIRQEPRAGKTAALNLAFPLAKGEIIVFSDANSVYAPNTVRHLVRNFLDPAVGYVTGRMIYQTAGGSGTGEGCSAYMRYENLLREWETQIGSIVGVDGGVDAIRRDLFVPMADHQLPDFVLPLFVIKQGYRVVYEPDAIVKENALERAGDEYAMRVRVALRALWALWDARSVLNPFADPLFAWQIWSHKLLRYLAFLFLAAAYGLNLVLWCQGMIYKVLFATQSLFYVIAFLAPVVGKRGYFNRIFYLPSYFVLLNAASAHAFCQFLSGKKQTLWTPRKGG